MRECWCIGSEAPIIEQHVDLRIGTSDALGVVDAVTQAVQAALSACASPVVALVFSTPDYDAEQVVATANRALGALPWAGSVTPAILHGHRVLLRGIAVGVIDGGEVRARIGVGGPMSAGAHHAGRRAALDALTDMPLPPADRSRAMILIIDTDRGDAAEALRGAVSVAGAGVAWSGGGMDDGGDARSVQFAQGRALRDHVVAIALDCRARVGTGVQHGWQPTGAPALVTRAQGMLLERLDDRPAVEVYRTAARERGELVEGEHFAAFAAAHPLGIPQVDSEHLVRDPFSVDADGAIRLAAGVPAGALVRVMDGTPEMLLAAAQVAATTAREDTGGPLGGALVFDCVSRAVMLGDRLGEELAACEAGLGHGVPLLGCLTAGEIGAFGARMPQFHNKTMVVLALPGHR